MTDVNFTFRVDENLKVGFIDTAKSLDLNASMLLRQFMRRTIETAGKNLDTQQETLLSDAEQQRRAEAIAYGQASVSLEGFPITDEAQALAARFVRGELSVKDYASATPEQAHER